MPPSGRAADGVAHLLALASTPRPTGTAAAARARAHCAAALRDLELEVTEHPFSYSGAVGRWGTPAGGAFAGTVLLIAAAEGSRGNARGALVLLVLALPLLALVGRWIARRGVLALPFARATGVNLEARRAGATPSLWLVAHADSKSQPVSIAVRAAGIALLALMWIALLLLAAGDTLRSVSGAHSTTSPAHGGWWLVLALLAIAGAAPVVASVVGAHSAGAVDNASGVATVLAAATLLRDVPGVGVLVTDAEELGLAGARGWCEANAERRARVINCDGVDDAGPITLMWTPPRAPVVEAALLNAASEHGIAARSIPLVPGVLVDGVAFADERWEVVTVSRGTIRTLQRVHRPSDNLTTLRGAGIADTARVIAGAARALAALEERR